MILFIAGMDTTGTPKYDLFIKYKLINIATLTVFAVNNLAEHVNVKEKLMKEIEEKLPQDNYTFDQVRDLEYLNAFVKETLRITSSVAGVIPRHVIKDTKIGHINVRKGDMVLLTIK